MFLGRIYIKCTLHNFFLSINVFFITRTPNEPVYAEVQKKKPSKSLQSKMKGKLDFAHFQLSNSCAFLVPDYVEAVLRSLKSGSIDVQIDSVLSAVCHLAASCI